MNLNLEKKNEEENCVEAYGKCLISSLTIELNALVLIMYLPHDLYIYITSETMYFRILFASMGIFLFLNQAIKVIMCSQLNMNSLMN